MAGRSIKGHVAVASTTLLFILNLLSTLGGIASIIIVFALEHSPSRVGWLFIIVGGVTVAAGLLGLCSSTRRGCFTWQFVLLVFSLIGLIAAALVVFFKPSQVVDKLNYKNSRTSALKVVKLEAAVFFITFCIQVAVLVMGICVNCCDLVDYYEDIEMTNRPRADLGRAQAESDRRAARREDSKASQLAEKMKQKYGKWTGEGEFDANRKSTLG